MLPAATSAMASTWDRGAEYAMRLERWKDQQANPQAMRHPRQASRPAPGPLPAL
jgi:hypothetical protein